MTRRLVHGLLVVAAIMLMAGRVSAAVAAEGVPKPAVVVERQGRCIAPAAEMRRNHMLLLKHQRDRTVRDGIRGEKASLKACIDCHASSRNGSVLGDNENFCQGCHAYVAVKLDCFECHQARAGREAVARAGGAR